MFSQKGVFQMHLLGGWKLINTPKPDNCFNQVLIKRNWFCPYNPSYNNVVNNPNKPLGKLT